MAPLLAEMGWLQTYCGSDPLGILSPSISHAFSACFYWGVLQCWDLLLFYLLTPSVLSCMTPQKARVAFRQLALPQFQQTLLAVLALLPLAQLLATIHSPSASPIHIVALILRFFAVAFVALLLNLHTSPSLIPGYTLIRPTLHRWLMLYILLSYLSTLLSLYQLITTWRVAVVLGVDEAAVLLATAIHTVLALTAIAALVSFAQRQRYRLPTRQLQDSSHTTRPLTSFSAHTSSAPLLADLDAELFDSDGDVYTDLSHGCLSSFTFAFVTPTIQLGRSQGYLHLTDIPPLTGADATADIATCFAAIWRQQVKSRKPPSLVAAFYHLLGRSYIALGVLKFVSDLTVFIGPILLNDLVTFLTSQAHDATPEPAWHGVLYATLLVLGVVLSSILGTQYTWRSRRLAMRVRSAIVSVVYSKSCSVSGLAKRSFGSGRVTNVMSVDTERIMDIFTSFHDFWSLPVQIAVALYLLHAQVGLALLAGLGVVVLLIPINAVLTNRIAKVSRRMMKCKDRRVQLTNEMLHHIRAIKSMALEPRFLARLRAIRRQEMTALTTRKYLDAFCVYFWATTPIIVSVATFAMYALLGNQLTAARVFTSLALFATLIRPLNSFPWVINGLSIRATHTLPHNAPRDDCCTHSLPVCPGVVGCCWLGLVEGRVSALRVYEFLCAEDRDDIRSLRAASAKEDELLMVNVRGSFSYSKAERNSTGKLATIVKRRKAKQPAANGTVTPPPRKRGMSAEEWLRLDQDSASASPTPQHSRTPSADKASNGATAPRVKAANGTKTVAVNGIQPSNGTTVTPAKAAQRKTTPNATQPYVFHLEDVSLQIRRGEFVGVCGAVGSGKSSLLLAMLGELWGMKRARLRPHAFVSGRVAYVAQEAWIQNSTLRDNVLFGLPMNEQRYRQVLDAVALTLDLQQLPAGDMTEIGEGGINLSGGQKVRVSIARAAYADCDVYLLDDILSAVDVHVGSHIMSQLVNGLLRYKTRVLVTHHTHFLRDADQIVQMRAGRIVNVFQADKGDESKQQQLDAQQWQPALAPQLPPMLQAELSTAMQRVKDQIRKKQEEKEEEEENYARLTVDESRQRGAIRRRVLRTYLAQIGGPLVLLILLSMVLMQGSRNYNDWYLGQWAEDTTVNNQNGSTTQSTTATTQSAPRFSSVSSPHTAPLHSLLSLSTPLLSSSEIGGDPSGLSHLRILCYIAAFNSLAALFRAFIFAYGGLTAARHMFDRLLSHVLYARILFFDQNPVGRILNRFSTDMYSIDENIPFQGNIFLAQAFLLLGSLTIIALTSPLFLLLVPPLAVLYLYMQRQYRSTSRELRRLDSVTRSPIYSSFSETLTGIYTIRAFGATERFLSSFSILLDTNQRVFYMALAASLWLNVRLQVLGIIVVAFLCYSAVALAVFRNELPSLQLLDISLVGLAIAYALPLTDTLNNLIGSFTDTEKEIVSVERAIEYMDIRTEKTDNQDDEEAQAGADEDVDEDDVSIMVDGTDGQQPGTVTRVKKLDMNKYLHETLLPFHRMTAIRLLAAATAGVTSSDPSAFPINGRIEFEDVTLIYRRGLQPALSHVSFTIPPGSHIGIVGRTGAGKSSLFQCMLRMRDLSGGAVLVGGVDVRNVPLPVLRRRLCVVPQSPVLFSGTVRDNVDVYNERSDAEVWRILQDCRIADKVRALRGGLKARVTETADHFSLGEKQLLCFARAMLQRARVIMLDEASASLDAVSDRHIQQLTASMTDCTVLVIAHRINTVMAMDRVLVIEQAVVVEYDTPATLMQRVGGMFRELVEQSEGKGGTLE